MGVTSHKRKSEQKKKSKLNILKPIRFFSPEAIFFNQIKIQGCFVCLLLVVSSYALLVYTVHPFINLVKRIYPLLTIPIH